MAKMKPLGKRINHGPDFQIGDAVKYKDTFWKEGQGIVTKMWTYRAGSYKERQYEVTWNTGVQELVDAYNGMWVERV